MGITTFICARVCNEGREGRGENAGFIYAGRTCPFPDDFGRAKLGQSTGGEKGRSGGIVSDLIGWLTGGDRAAVEVSPTGGNGGVTATSPGEIAGGPEILAKGSSSRNGVGEVDLESSGIVRDLRSTEGVMDDEPEDPGRLDADCGRFFGKLEDAGGEG